jgi:hypothetical protein
MAEQGLDALVLAQPESIKYATGAFPGVTTFWRRVGASIWSEEWPFISADATAMAEGMVPTRRPITSRGLAVSSLKIS